MKLNEKSVSISMIKKVITTTRRFIDENLGAPFIIGFQILILLCASLLTIENIAVADNIAVCAYFFLGIGIILQAVSFIRKRRETPNESH